MSTTSTDTRVVEGDDPGADGVAAPDAAGTGPAGVERPLARRTARSGVPPAGLGLVGALAVLVGAWGGIVPFAGASFGFNADGSPSWYWNLAHALLWMVPGAVATACGLALLGLVPRARLGRARLGSLLGGLLVVACGAWFVIGWLAWPVLQHSAGVFVPASAVRELEYQVGYSLGPGLGLAVLGAFAIGWAVRSRRVVAVAPRSEPARRTATDTAA